MQNLGIGNILGRKDGSTVQCRVSGSPGGAGTTYTINLGPDGQWLTSNFLGSSNYKNRAIAGLDTGNAGSACPAVTNAGSPIEEFGTLVSVEPLGTGIYEYQGLATNIGLVAVVLAVIMAGITLAKRHVSAINEETSDDDAVEWYIGPDGKEYWRIKGAVKRRIGYD